MHLQTSIKLAFLGALSLSSSAATIWYTDRGSWLAAQSRPIQTIGFEGIAPSGGEAHTATDPGFTLSGISFTGKLLSEGCSPVSGCYGPTPSNLTYIADRFAEFSVFLNPTLFQWSTGAVYAGPIILAVTYPNSAWDVTFGSTDIGLGSGKHALGWDYRLATVPYDPGIVKLSNGETQRTDTQVFWDSSAQIALLRCR